MGEDRKNYSSLDDEINTGSKRKDNSGTRTGSTERKNRYREETAAEIAGPRQFTRSDEVDSDQASERSTAGTTFGIVALALSVLSLFMMPFLFGAAGIVLGFMARRRGAETLGAWAIGVGVVSLIVGVFILPFF